MCFSTGQASATLLMAPGSYEAVFKSTASVITRRIHLVSLGVMEMTIAEKLKVKKLLGAYCPAHWL